MGTQRSPIRRRPFCSSEHLQAIDSHRVCRSEPSLQPDYPSSGISENSQDPHEKRKDVGESCRHETTISALADYIFLEIFDFYRNSHDPEKGGLVWKWHILVQVCQKWRRIVFASPRRLNLQILCSNKTPVRKNLGIWPALPIVITYGYSGRSKNPRGEGNIIAALQHPDRVCDVELDINGSQLEKMSKVMKKPFPVLERLLINSNDGSAPILPGRFLGGSAPGLREIALHCISYPALPTLLFSASNLVEFDYRDIPPTGYVSPMMMVACLAALPRLKRFLMEFRSATSRPDRILRPPVTRTVLPALSHFEFVGANEYLEHLVARIDGPQLDGIIITYLNQLVDLQVPQLSKFIDRSVGHKLTLFKHAEFFFQNDWVSFTMYPRANHPFSDWRPARIFVSCKDLDWQVWHIAQVVSQFSATIATFVHLKLDIDEDPQSQDTNDVEWQHLLHQFSTVKTLHVPRKLAAHVSLALEDTTGETVVNVLPSLELIYLEGHPASSIEKFIAARQRSGRPVTLVRTETEFEERLKSYHSK